MTIEKILIVDDEPYVLEVCRRVLEEKYHVKIVHSGVEAIQLAQDERFDLLLTDIKMPGLDGLETAKEVRKNNPDIVCVTMTGYSSMETAIKALRLGIDEFIIKPFNPEELILAVERALEKERLRKENIRLKSLLPLFEFNKSLMSTVETKRLLQQILDLARQEIGASDIILYMIEESGVISHLTLSEIPSKRLEVLLKYRDELVKAIQCKNAQLAIEDEEDTIIFLRGGWQDIALEVEELDDEHALLEDLLSVLKVKSMVATPLLGVGGKLQGVLLLTKRNQIFTQSECNFLSVMTGQATIAYENARLFENLQQAYDELKTLDYMKSEFTNRAAHELRTPLAIIVGYASILEEDIEDKTQKGYLKIILRNSLRLRSLVEDLLNMRYIASGQLPL
ncbi:MAG: response regulator, partial [Phycisphaerae bacterium]|nr:response regulator [Phycisphaerae bacterium]NIX30217.1 response regulator [Phycisphaerae bacterium]